MAYYENRREHHNGAMLLFQRNLNVAVPNVKSHRSKTWYMRLKIGGIKRSITRSTKLTKYEDAYIFAEAEYFRQQQASQLGHIITSGLRTFETGV